MVSRLRAPSRLNHATPQRDPFGAAHGNLFERNEDAREDSGSSFFFERCRPSKISVNPCGGAAVPSGSTERDPACGEAGGAAVDVVISIEPALRSNCWFVAVLLL